MKRWIIISVVVLAIIWWIAAAPRREIQIGESVVLAYSDLADRLGVADLVSISVRADIRGALEICARLIPE